MDFQDENVPVVYKVLIIIYLVLMGIAQVMQSIILGYRSAFQQHLKKIFSNNKMENQILFMNSCKKTFIIFAIHLMALIFLVFFTSVYVKYYSLAYIENQNSLEDNNNQQIQENQARTSLSFIIAQSTFYLINYPSMLMEMFFIILFMNCFCQDELKRQRELARVQQEEFNLQQQSFMQNLENEQILTEIEQLEMHRDILKRQKLVKEADKAKLEYNKLFMHSENSVDSLDCIICLDQIKFFDIVVQLKCNKDHIFHFNCVKEWFKEKSSCPLCRSNEENLARRTGQVQTSESIRINIEECQKIKDQISHKKDLLRKSVLTHQGRRRYVRHEATRAMSQRHSLRAR
ncbi:UNKNOWN [Stylonychia lemnae]|uniref:RING-type domain-containing protein n=1 Tax=Stylonychia lemnae TaxID=5949 RepID=A0A078AB54_STYLE|nr:UNKNOWN [Stylonychia lemnae]|eukprot:CDW79111.1 UNKNOWN [Stylonychia lemnae]